MVINAPCPAEESDAGGGGCCKDESPEVELPEANSPLAKFAERPPLKLPAFGGGDASLLDFCSGVVCI